MMRRIRWFLLGIPAIVSAADVRITNDTTSGGGYVSVYTQATGVPYTDAVLSECSKARGRQNEPAVAMDPRHPSVILASSNDYCGVYAGSPDSGPFVPSGPIWLGYYRSENGGASFVSSLVPGYPGDVSPYAQLAKVRTASAGDPVIAWDGHGRVFFGSESSGDPAGTKKTLGDEWVARFDNPDGETGGKTGSFQNDGKRFLGSVIVAKGSSAPNLLGKFNDKTAIQADRTGGVCDSFVYFSWSRFTGNSSNIYFSRSTDHGETWSSPMLLTPDVKNVQDPDISVTANGHVYVTFGQGTTNSGQKDAVLIAKSTDCGANFSKPAVVTTFIPYNAQDIASPQPVPAPAGPDDPLSAEGASAPGSLARDCGDFQDACQSGFTFFRRSTAPRSSADQGDRAHEWVYIVYDPTKPGTQVSTGTSYGSISPGIGSQSAIYFIRFDGATGMGTAPALIDGRSTGHQFFPDISADGGYLHAMWWDSRNDPAYSPMRPIGNDVSGVTHPSLDVRKATSINGGNTWTLAAMNLNVVTSNPNYEQFDNRSVPFAGDYLWITSVGSVAFAVWTDWRDTAAGMDPRELSATDGANVRQCRTFNPSTQTWSTDMCPHEGGLDQNIYGAPAPASAP